MRLIDTDRLLTDRMKSKYYHLPNGDIAIPLIDIEHAPTIEPERKTGKWMPDATGWEFCCSECGYSVMFGGEANTFKYCPECGAKMEETE